MSQAVAHVAHVAHKKGSPKKTVSVKEVCEQLGVSRRTAYRRMQRGELARPNQATKGPSAKMMATIEVESAVAKIYRLNANELARNLIADLDRLRDLSIKAQDDDQLDLAISATSRAASIAANVLKGGWLANALSGRTEEGENLEELASEELEKRLKEFEAEGVELP